MLDVLAKVIIPLLTILFSGLVSAYITHKLSATRADKEFRLKRLEELFLSLDRFLTNYFGPVTLPLIPVMAGKMSYDTVRSAVEKLRDPKAGEELKKVEMLVRVYFPELRPRYDAMITLRNKIGAEFIAPMHSKSADLSTPKLQAFTTAMDDFHRLSDEFKESIFQIADKTRPRSTFRKVHDFVSEQMRGA